jgi:hypothetical protein
MGMKLCPVLDTLDGPREVERILSLGAVPRRGDGVEHGQENAGQKESSGAHEEGVRCRVSGVRRRMAATGRVCLERLQADEMHVGAEDRGSRSTVMPTE